MYDYGNNNIKEANGLYRRERKKNLSTALSHRSVPIIWDWTYKKTGSSIVSGNFPVNKVMPEPCMKNINLSRTARNFVIKECLRTKIRIADTQVDRFFI